MCLFLSRLFCIYKIPNAVGVTPAYFVTRNVKYGRRVLWRCSGIPASWSGCTRYGVPTVERGTLSARQLSADNNWAPRQLSADRRARENGWHEKKKLFGFAHPIGYTKLRNVQFLRIQSTTIFSRKPNLSDFQIVIRWSFRSVTVKFFSFKNFFFINRNISNAK